MRSVVVGDAAHLMVGVEAGFADERPHVGLAGPVEDVAAGLADVDNPARRSRVRCWRTPEALTPTRPARAGCVLGGRGGPRAPLGSASYQCRLICNPGVPGSLVGVRRIAPMTDLLCRLRRCWQVCIARPIFGAHAATRSWECPR